MRIILLVTLSLIFLSAEAGDLSIEREKCKNFLDARLYDIAIQPCEIVANTGDMDYQFKLVIAYSSEGQFEKAEQWVEKLTENGQVGACHYIGLKYAEQNDIHKAVNWFETCAKKGNELSSIILGEIYINGGMKFIAENTIEKDDERGVYWLENAAKHGNREAISALIKYYQSVGDEQRAKHWKSKL